MSTDMLEYCDKAPIEGNEKNIGLDGAAKQFLSAPENIARLRSYIKYYASFDEINIYFNEDFIFNLLISNGKIY